MGREQHPRIGLISIKAPSDRAVDRSRQRFREFQTACWAEATHSKGRDGLCHSIALVQQAPLWDFPYLV